ncbi:lipase 1-like isoform X1 [Drosophila gunungcola]|uniref:lipase 1-like isoform X1 n=2 Tax=Drosophila gunungcola TaxID=103775 RepID=UPI0022E0D7B2|nr:lipase 1-like isoform X1 [Drosophila gunungcola]
MLLMKFVIFCAWVCIAIASAKRKVKFGLQNFTGHPNDYRLKVFTGVHIIATYNYPVETHTVLTRDGYILDNFRIPSSERCRKSGVGVKPAVLIQHGMTASADSFLMTGPRSALPFLLADACYDVWLSNCRGVRYSQRHSVLKSSQDAFWRFSWHEIGMEDLSAQIDYILATTGHSALHFVGHSQGCTTLMVLLSMRPEYNRKIKTTSLLAPAAFMHHSTDGMINMLEKVIMEMKDCNFFGHTSVLNFVLALLCHHSTLKKLCTSLFLLSNSKSKNMNQSIVPLLLATHPGGISSRQPKHFLQIRKSRKFRPFDFGPKQNKKIYKQCSPPNYPLEKVRPMSPIHIYYSDGDKLTSARDVLKLASKLDNVVKHHIADSSWEHTDFLFAKTVDTVINQPVIKVIDQFESKRKWKTRYY